MLLVALPRLHELKLPARDVTFFALYGAIGFALFEYLYFAALERMEVSVAVALLYTAPAFVALLSRVLWKERLGRRRIAALALVLGGVVLVTGALRSLAGGLSLSGAAAALGLASGLTYGLYTIFSKLALLRQSVVSSLFWSFAFAALCLGIIAPPLAPVLRSPASLPWLLALGLLPTLLAYFLYLRALRTLRASTASMLAAAEPVIAALLAAALLGERLGIDQAAGMLLIVAAAVILVRSSGPAEAGRS